MLLLTRRTLLSFAARTAATFLVPIPWAIRRSVSENNFVPIGSIDQSVATRGRDRFWYLGSGGEIPDKIADSDRLAWKALKDHETQPQSAGWRPVTIELEMELNELPDLFHYGSKYIVSPRLRRMCERFHANCEYLPVKIVQPKGNVWPEQYAVMHPLERIDCIDFAASDFDQYGSGEKFIVARFRRLVFRPEKIGDRAVFRPQHYSPIFVSNAFREAALRARLAVEFYPLDGQER